MILHWRSMRELLQFSCTLQLGCGCRYFCLQAQCEGAYFATFCVRFEFCSVRRTLPGCSNESILVIFM